MQTTLTRRWRVAYTTMHRTLGMQLTYGPVDGAAGDAKGAEHLELPGLVSDLSQLPADADRDAVRELVLEAGEPLFPEGGYVDRVWVLVKVGQPRVRRS